MKNKTLKHDFTTFLQMFYFTCNDEKFPWLKTVK